MIQPECHLTNIKDDASSIPLVYVVNSDAAQRATLDILLRSCGWRTSLHHSMDELLSRPSHADASCLLWEISLPGRVGLDSLRTLTSRKPAIPVVLMTGTVDVPTVVWAMRAGAIDVLPKPFSDHQLIGAVQAGVEVGLQRRDEDDRLGAVRQRLGRLTRREVEVMGLVIAGLMNKQVAWRLGLSEVTVKIHRGNVMRKMEAASLPDLVRMASLANVGVDTSDRQG